MIPKDCKRLAEVDFAIATMSKHAAREKSIRHGQDEAHAAGRDQVTPTARDELHRRRQVRPFAAG